MYTQHMSHAQLTYGSTLHHTLEYLQSWYNCMW